MKHKETLRKITQSIALNYRKDMIKTIRDYSGEEYENLDDLWELAKENKKLLRDRLFTLYDYFLDN